MGRFYDEGMDDNRKSRFYGVLLITMRKLSFPVGLEVGMMPVRRDGERAADRRRAGLFAFGSTIGEPKPKQHTFYRKYIETGNAHEAYRLGYDAGDDPHVRLGGRRRHGSASGSPTSRSGRPPALCLRRPATASTGSTRGTEPG